jgi:hypothetical protein
MLVSMSRSNPVIFKNVVYDTHTRTLYTGSCDKEYNIHFLCAITSASSAPGLPITPYEEDLIEVSQPTYMCSYYHFCFGHAYIDFTIPLLSILNEIDVGALAAREFRLFMLKDNIYLTDELAEEKYATAANDMDDYLRRKINFTANEYNGEMRHLHKCFSKYPILFEKNAPSRFYRFETLIMGGNIDNQRCIHNHANNYPDRFSGTAEATPSQIRGWMDVARKHFGSYLGIPEVEPRPQKPYTIILGRKENRSFLPKTLTHMEFDLTARDDIEFGGLVYLEDMTLAEQITTFQKVDILISTHGSGLTHLFWSKPGTRLLEVFLTAERRVGIFPHFCKFLGIQETTYIVNPESLFSIDWSFDVDDKFWKFLDNFILNSMV